MATRRRGGLGSGLDALFTAGVEPAASLREVPIEQIHPNPRQPRTEFEEQALQDLAASIKEHGVIQPLVVSQTSPGRYELIAGERRWRAAKQAGLEQVPILVREAAPQQILELALIENVQRADLNALEEARAYQTLADEFGLSDNEIARRLGKSSREAIANTRRLLQLVPEAQAAVLRGTITAGHGRALLMIKDAERQQAALDAVQTHDLSVRATERLANLVDVHSGDVAMAVSLMQRQETRSSRPARRNTQARETSRPALAADDLAVQRALEDVLGTPVSISRSDREVRVTIAFHTEEKLQEFFDWVNNR